MSRRAVERLAEGFTLWIKEAAPTLVILLLAVLSGVPPWSDVLVDLRRLFSLLVQ